jgi:hypothetical protein
MEESRSQRRAVDGENSGAKQEVEQREEEGKEKENCHQPATLDVYIEIL